MTEKTDSGRSTTVARRAATLFWLIVTIVPIVGVIISIVSPAAFSLEQERIRQIAASVGVVGPLAFIAIQALQVVVAPISHYSVGYVGGLLYGTLWGSLYNWLGRVIGHSLAFLLARKLGRPFAERFVPAETLAKYDSLVSKGYIPLFLMYFLPLFPDDELSYLAGLGKMRFSWFFLANILGHVGGSVSLAYLGSGLDTRDPLFWVLSLSTLLAFPILWFFIRPSSRKNA